VAEVVGGADVGEVGFGDFAVVAFKTEVETGGEVGVALLEVFHGFVADVEAEVVVLGVLDAFFAGGGAVFVGDGPHLDGGDGGVYFLAGALADVAASDDEIVVDGDADAKFGDFGGRRGDVVDEGVVEGAEVDVGGFGGLLLLFHVVCCFLIVKLIVGRSRERLLCFLELGLIQKFLRLDCHFQCVFLQYLADSFVQFPYRHNGFLEKLGVFLCAGKLFYVHKFIGVNVYQRI